MAPKGLFLCALVVLAVAELAVEPATAMSCLDVDLALQQCVPYLVGLQPEPTAACCEGVLRLKNMAATTADKRLACVCAKAAAAHVQGLKDSAVSALPAKCNAPLPYPISPSFDCNQIS